MSFSNTLAFFALHWLLMSDKAFSSSCFKLFRLEPGVHNSLIVLYSLVIIFGVIGNFAIILAFLTNKVMLTTRNIFIANLAISDILLCTFTMPLTLVDLLTKVRKKIISKNCVTSSFTQSRASIYCKMQSWTSFLSSNEKYCIPLSIGPWDRTWSTSASWSEPPRLAASSSQLSPSSWSQWTDSSSLFILPQLRFQPRR